MANIETLAADTRYFAETAAPSTPSSGQGVAYEKSDGKLYFKNDAGTEYDLTLGASGDVSTDAIWDAKGDLAAGTGANAAAKVTVGADGAILVADSSQSTGLRWAGRVLKYKSADESVANTTFQDDDHLVFAIGASESWVVEYVLFATNAANTADLKAAITVPSGATARFGIMGTALGATTNEASLRQQVTGAATALAAGVVASGTIAESMVRCYAFIENSTNAGNVTLQWAENTSDGTNATTVKKGSWLLAHRVA